MLTDTEYRAARPKEKLCRLKEFNGLYLDCSRDSRHFLSS